MMRLAYVACALPLAIVVAACGTNDMPCGAECQVQARTTVKWTFDAYPDKGFAMDSCVDFMVGKVQIDVIDSGGVATTQTEMCGNAQTVFEGLAPGDYTINVMPLDYDGAALLSGPATGTITAGDANTETTVNVTWDQWAGGPYTGTFLFKLSWGGLSCEQTDVRTQTVKLTVGGVVQNIMTDDGELLDGSDRRPCKKLTDNFPQSALGVAFGPATLLVEGFDASNSMRYSKQFDTFVGAGITNPTLTFNVPTTP